MPGITQLQTSPIQLDILSGNRAEGWVARMPEHLSAVATVERA